MILFDNVSFSYDTIPVLSDISFSVKKGEFISLIGENGSGKSTLLKLFNGLNKPASGTVNICGLDTRSAKTSELAAHVGFLFQNPDRQICCNTIREELNFGIHTDPVRTESLMRTFGFNPDDSPFTLSRGQRQQIALASVIARNTGILVLDEPTTGLDYRECTSMMTYVQKLNREEGKTIIMVSHDMEIVQDFSDRILVLAGGKLIADGPARTVLVDRTLLEQASLLPPQIADTALRLGNGFSDIFTVQEMTDRVQQLKSAAVQAQDVYA
ncbi:MAG TPA: ABC transporter ATP-binding protein [Treponema sp.]|nr:ABC transporter ATP-binding protein [Treponema sp.]